MARIRQDVTDTSPSTPRAPVTSYGHGHASSVGYGHGVIRDAARPAAKPTPPPQRVTLVLAVDERLDPPVATALRVHDAGVVLRPSLFPPRRGERLPQYGLPSTAAERLAMFRSGGEERSAARALSILAR